MRLKTINEAVDDEEYDDILIIPATPKRKEIKMRTKRFETRTEAEKWLDKHPGWRIVKTQNKKGHRSTDAANHITWVAKDGRGSYVE